MADILETLRTTNLISVLIVITILVTALSGWRKGGTGSAKELIRFAVDTGITVASVFLAWTLAERLSPKLSGFLADQSIRVPERELNLFSQLYYTFVTGLRDFSLMRTALLFFIGYMVVRGILSLILFTIVDFRPVSTNPRASSPRSGAGKVFSGMLGVILGGITGTGRALLLVAGLFIFTSLVPQSQLTDYINRSEIYQKSTEQVIEPLTGNWLSNRLPVFTQAVQEEMSRILQRRYEIVDANIPDTIAEAAVEVTADLENDEDKAKALYRWVGTRVRYDWDKYDLYVDQGIWKEQTPADTFASRRGVCIDYSRLYAMMARSVGLDVRVVTGLGSDGSGGYGAHAWNEVFLEAEGWVPLDTTWVSSGGNWFNPPDFDLTHIPEQSA